MSKEYCKYSTTGAYGTITNTECAELLESHQANTQVCFTSWRNVSKRIVYLAPPPTNLRAVLRLWQFIARRVTESFCLSLNTWELHDLNSCELWLTELKIIQARELTIPHLVFLVQLHLESKELHQRQCNLSNNLPSTNEVGIQGNL